MLLDMHGYSHYHENKHFLSLQKSYKPLESCFHVLMASLEDNMIDGTNYINEMLLLFPNNY